MSVPITLSDVRKVFGTGSSLTRAVDGISQTIDAGELFFLLGPSGCGKTTLLRMIAGFIDPSGGAVRFGDRDVTHLAPNKRNTGMVFQSYALWPHMTVAANVAFGLGVRKVAGEEKQRRVQEALDAVQMGTYGDRKPNQLSGGQQQRIALARALVIRPDVLLLDEPLSNLDAKLRIELRSEIRRVCKQSGITTVYVTHDQKEALSMADRVAILESGKVIQTGPPSELYRSPRTPFVASFLGETNFVPGRISARDGDRATIETAAGSLISTHPGLAYLNGATEVVCSIRPEAARLGGSGGNDLAGVVRESVYLGEIAQHRIDLAGETPLRIAELNPMPRSSDDQSPVRVTVEPSDVVVLPRE